MNKSNNVKNYTSVVNENILRIIKYYKKYNTNKQTIKNLKIENGIKKKYNTRFVLILKTKNKKIVINICKLITLLQKLIKNIEHNEISENNLKIIINIINSIKCKNTKFDVKKLVNCTSCKKYDKLIINKEKEYCSSNKNNKIVIQKELKMLDSLKIKHCKELCNTCIKLLNNYDRLLLSQEKGFIGDITNKLREISNNINTSSECKNSYKLCNNLNNNINTTKNNDYKNMLVKHSIELGCNKILNSKYYEKISALNRNDLDIEYKQLLLEDSSFKMDDIEKIIDEELEKMEIEEEYSKLLEDTKITNPEYFANKKIRRKIKKYCEKNNCDINDIINIMNNMKISNKQLETNADEYLSKIFEDMKLK